MVLAFAHKWTNTRTYIYLTPCHFASSAIFMKIINKLKS